MKRAYDIPALKAGLLSRIDQLVQDLAPGGKWQGRYYFSLNPTRRDRNIGSFWIVTRGGKTGAWCDAATGDKGDVIDLIRYCQQFETRGEALKWASQWLSLPPKCAASPISAPIDARSDAEKARSAARWFSKGVPIRGTPAERYLAEARGIRLPAGEDWPLALRFFPSLKYPYNNHDYPVLMAAYTNHKRQVCAVHRTFLQKDGTGKAPVTSPRLSWPGFRGCVIRLRSRPSRHLILAEGLEDGLSCMIAAPDCAVWAFGSLGNLVNVRVPKVERVTVFKDNDWGNGGAQDQLLAGLEKLARQCRDVRMAMTPVGKDANDGLRV